jgi:hypothetical protein
MSLFFIAIPTVVHLFTKNMKFRQEPNAIDRFIEAIPTKFDKNA